jgi:succinate dehydrogenase / fumarate reductase cytochrome b subunit
MGVGSAAEAATGAGASGSAVKLLLFYQSAIGKKFVMAVTGLILFGFVLVHMLGNLQVYLGAAVMNEYGRKLHEAAPLLWGARAVLLASVLLHIVAALQLMRLNAGARPQGYVKLSPQVSNYATRTMRWSGPILAAFIIYHLLHFTTGTAHPDFAWQDRAAHVPAPYENVVAGFSNPLVSAFYILSMILLGMHINHGAWSLFQSIGFHHPRYTPLLRKLGRYASYALVAGNCSIPIAVMAGVVR